MEKWFPTSPQANFSAESPLRVLLWTGILMLLSAELCGCGSAFRVKSEPLQAEVFVIEGKTGTKKSLGKTPIEMPISAVKQQVGEDLNAGSFFNVTVEKPGFITQSFSIPATRFGTMVTQLDVKLKEGKQVEEEKIAKVILEHLFLAQKLALSQQFERAQIEIDKILADFPNFPRALSMRGSIYYAQKNYTESLKWYDEALKADPQLEEVVKMSAKVRALQSGRVPAGSADAPKVTK